MILITFKIVIIQCVNLINNLLEQPTGRMYLINFLERKLFI